MKKVFFSIEFGNHHSYDLVNKGIIQLGNFENVDLKLDLVLVLFSGFNDLNLSRLLSLQ